MGTNGIPWSKAGHDGRVIMMRKRNNSSCDFPTGKNHFKQFSSNLSYLIIYF